LPWRHLSASHLTQLASLPSLPSRREALSTFLGLEFKYSLGQVTRRDPLANAAQRAAALEAERVLVDPNYTRREIVLDFSMALLGFCWSQELSAVKTSTIFSIVYTLHESVAERSSGPPTPLAQAV
jgi:hypothetical protein